MGELTLNETEDAAAFDDRDEDDEDAAVSDDRDDDDADDDLDEAESTESSVESDSCFVFSTSNCVKVNKGKIRNRILEKKNTDKLIDRLSVLGQVHRQAFWT